MRWLPFLILAYLAIALQMGLEGFWNIGAAWPNLVLIVAVFVAIHARREHALAGVFLLGLMQDLCSSGPPGLYAFSYGMVALFIVGAQREVHRNHPLTHFFITLLAALAVGVIAALRAGLSPVLHGLPGQWQGLGPMIASTLYTALLAVALLRLLGRFRGLFGFKMKPALRGAR